MLAYVLVSNCGDLLFWEVAMLEEDDSSTIDTRLPAPLAYGADASSANSRSNPVRSDQLPVASSVNVKTQQNAAILQASLDVSIQSKNDPLALLLKSAITGINELLKPQFGENALQAAASEDNTPDGTAGRIVSLSTGFFDAFKRQHPNEDANDVLTNFMDIIRGGFEKGAKEAQEILKGMGVLNGDIASNIDKTLAIVQQGYADFETAQRAILANVGNLNSDISATAKSV
jgi:hypothetical protein